MCIFVETNNITIIYTEIIEFKLQINTLADLVSGIISYYKSFLMSNQQLALEFKTKGNEAFKAKKWQEAIEFFTKAIEYNPNDHVFYSNRSGSYLNNGQYQQALQDAEACIKYCCNYSGSSQNGQGDIKEKELRSTIFSSTIKPSRHIRKD